MVPKAWHAIAKGSGRGAKAKITLWVEADVLAFFRAMGTGHTSRMADVLKALMSARLVNGPVVVEYGGQVDAVGRLQRRTAALIEALRRQ